MNTWIVLCYSPKKTDISDVVDTYGPFKSEKTALQYIDKHVDKSGDHAYAGGVRTPEADFCEGLAERQEHTVAELYKP